jgi:hypothetical protein
MSQFEQWVNVRFWQKLGKSASKMFQMIKQVYSEEALGCSAVFKWHKRFAQLRDKMISISVGQERSELNSRAKKLQRQCVSTAPKR